MLSAEMSNIRPPESRRPGIGALSKPKMVVAILVVLAVCATPLLSRPARGDQLSDKRAEAAGISAKLAELESRQVDLGAQYERANYELHLAETKVQEAQEQADATQAELERRRGELQSFSVQAYVSGNDSGTANVILTSDPGKGVEKRAYVEATSGNRTDMIDSLNAARQAAENDAVALEQAREEAAGHAAQIEEAKKQADAAAGEQRALNNKVQGELATLVAEENARRQAEEAARAQAAAAEAAARAAAAAPATTAPARATAQNTRANPATQVNPANPAASAPAPDGPVVAPPPTSGATSAISAALSKMGAPYVWGAGGPGAFDCSGLVMWAYAQVGISLPHYSGAQYAMTTRLSRAQLQPGDLVFWGGAGSEHVAIYMGGNQLVHTFRAGVGVAITPLDGWWKAPSGYGRINR